MMRRIIGIDPGITGGIAALDVSAQAQPELVCATATPTLITTRKGKTTLDYDVRAMYQLVADLVEGAPAGGCVVVLERAHAMPGQGRGSTFRTGIGWGLWRGVLASLAVEVQHVAPQVWKLRQHLIHRDKRASVLYAKDKFPALARLTTSQHGIAEAALIAATAAEC